ncbi:uncharacterized protein LOC128202041 [Galleria mellonella]|uniref:Uncharacterized protein LOC128202041 n=1 Tax=Galleria mellonella TaxID=7137 RepID=A0ABM3N023_GALME|nr:uncharacterized protein LOC128202041 [Galleria mellonella]
MTQKHKDSWKCLSCKSRVPKKDNTNTPIRPEADNVTQRRGGSALSPDRSSASPEHMANTTTNEMLLKEIRLLRDDMREMHLQMQSFTDTISSLNLRIDACENRLDELGIRMDKMERRTSTDSVFQSDTSLLQSIENLKIELNDRDQDLLLNDLQISCIPEQKGENVTHNVISIASKLGMQLTVQDITSAVRVGRLLDSDNKVSGRPRLVVVRLARRALRDQLLQAARVRRGATAEGTEIPGPPSKFYINERLTLKNRQLFQRARELGVRHNWRYVWTRDGKIFVRQHQGEDTPRYRIRTDKDLTRVFGSAAVQ